MSTTVPPPSVGQPASTQPPVVVSGAPAPAPGPPPAASRPHRRPSLARVVGGAVVLVAAGGIALLLRPKPLAVESAPVLTAPMQVTVEADAVTRVRAHFAVTAPVSGLVRRITLREGDSVRMGEVVAVITTPPVPPTDRRAADARADAARAALGQVTARVGAADAALRQAQREASRTRQLASAGALAERDVELAAVTVSSRRADLDALRAQVRAASAELALARAAQDAAAGTGAVATPVHAPAGGRVLRIQDPSARVVIAGSPLLEIGDPSSLEVAADVLSSDAAAIRAGQPVVLRGWGGAPLQGVVRRVEPSARTRVSALGVEEQRLNVVIDLRDTPPTLGDGYRLDASVVVWEGRAVRSIPSGALLRLGDGWAVYRVREGRAERRVVRVGHVGSGRAEVLGGLDAHDSVVVFPPDELRDGARVRAVP